MSDILTARQMEALYALQEGGSLPLDGLAARLGISRAAAARHLDGLLRAGYAEEAGQIATGGRPVREYRVSGKGKEIFPRQYAWFAEILIAIIKSESGSDSVTALLKKAARDLARKEGADILALKPSQRLAAISHFMSALGYNARADRKDEIVATNCVYHHIARAHPEICEFDIALLAELAEGQVAHLECMAKGESACRFRITAPQGEK